MLVQLQGRRYARVCAASQGDARPQEAYVGSLGVGPSDKLYGAVSCMSGLLVGVTWLDLPRLTNLRSLCSCSDGYAHQIRIPPAAGGGGGGSG